MKKILLRFNVITILILLCVATEGQAYSLYSANGHRYEIFHGTYTWEEAQTEARAQGYHLATITDVAEQAFIQNLLSDYTGEFWLGAYQDPTEWNAKEKWSWVTGEAWDYTNWKSTEANDWANIQEMHLGIWSRYSWQWNDEHAKANIVGYVAEAAPVPEPATMMLLGTGLIGLAGLARKKMSKQ